jgi:hypothetical protein
MLVEDLKEGRGLGLEMKLSLSFNTVLDDAILMFLGRDNVNTCSCISL